MSIKSKLNVSSKQAMLIKVKTGIDIVCIKDVQDLADVPTEVWITEQEWKDVLAVSNETHQLQRLAGKFACKEAVLKVLGSGIDEIELVDIEVLHDISGKPIVSLQKSALSSWHKIAAIDLDVSISHEGAWAIAIAVATCQQDYFL